MVVNYLLAPALALIAIAAGIGARALWHLDRRCNLLESHRSLDRGLLRWYSQGFDRPLRLTQWLTRLSLAVLIAAIALHAHISVIAAALLVLSLSFYGSRLGRTRQRQHWELALRSGAGAPRR